MWYVPHTAPAATLETTHAPPIQAIIGSKDFQEFLELRGPRALAAELGPFLQRLGLSGETQSAPIPQELFHELYDPRLPTLGTTAYRFDGVGLIACAARARSEAGLPSINVVFLPAGHEECQLSWDAHDRAHLVVDRGTMVSRDGRIVTGCFPEPVPIDCVSAFSFRPDAFTRRCEALGVRQLNPQRVLEIASDKGVSKRLLQELGIRVPRALQFSAGAPGEQIVDQIHDFIKTPSAGGWVIKPTHLSGGTGVRLAPPDARAEDLRALTDTCLRQFGSCMLEERIESLPCLTREGARLDWNVRVLAHSGGMFDMEVRYGPWGTVINKARGAAIEEAARFLALFPAELRPKCADLHEEIEQVTAKISHALDGNFIGLDFIWSEPDERGRQLCVIELNAGCVGGLGSLFDLRTGSARLAAPAKLVEHLAGALAPGAQLGPAESFRRHDVHAAAPVLRLVAGLGEYVMRNEHTCFSDAESQELLLAAIELLQSEATLQCEPDELLGLSDELCHYLLETQSAREVLRYLSWLANHVDPAPLQHHAARAYAALGKDRKAADLFKRALARPEWMNYTDTLVAADLSVRLADYELLALACDRLEQVGSPDLNEVVAQIKAVYRQRNMSLEEWIVSALSSVALQMAGMEPRK